MKVVKSDGKREDFDSKKIRRGIERSAERAKIDKARTREIAEKVAKDVESAFRDRKEVRSADIRERVLSTLSREDRKIADSFRNYRSK
ncbi:MAG: hypothetical protein HY518_03345 [Candidatus Aenigmarchaeota archaeon]|nr:hypothetical protein [Candidatus Aenigmarchaeota archaeon]